MRMFTECWNVGMTSPLVSLCLAALLLHSSSSSLPHFTLNYLLEGTLIKKEEWSGVQRLVGGELGTTEVSVSSFQELPAALSFVSRVPEGEGRHGAVVLETLNESQVIQGLSQVSLILGDRRRWVPMVFLSLPQSLTSLDNLRVTLEGRRDLHFPLDSDVYLLQGSKVTEVYHIRDLLVLQDIPDLLPSSSPPAVYSLNKKNPRRSDFRRLAIRAVSMDVHGYELATDFEDDNTTETRFAGGFEVEQYWYLRDALNFTEWAQKGTSFIREGPNKTLRGMAEPVNSGEVELCIGATEFLEYRISGPEGITYLHPTFYIQMRAFFKQPPASSIRDVFTSAFSWSLWVGMVLLWAGVASALHLAYFLYDVSSTRVSDRDGEMRGVIGVWAAGATCQQGLFITPVATSARIVFFSGWFFGLLSYTAFSAQLVSILAVQVVPVKDFQDLLHGDFFLFNDGHIPTTKFFVQGLEDDGKIRRLPVERRNVEIDATIERLLRTRAAMVSVTDSFYPIVQKEGYSDKVICDKLSEVRVGSRPVKMSMFVRRGSPLRDIFNTRIVCMSERGVRHRLMRSYLMDTSVQCLQGDSGGRSPIAWKDLFTAYGLLSGGVSLAFSLLLVEKMLVRIGKGPAGTLVGYVGEYSEYPMVTFDLNKFFDKTH